MQPTLKFTLAAMAFTIAGASQLQAQGPMRFRGMDANGDGRISFREWQGSEASFRQQDWNGDGVLSGDEVRPGARRQTSWNQDWNRDGIIDQQDTLIAQRFRNYDNNGDSRVSSGEWTGNRALFGRLDTNRDGYLSMTEYTNNGGFTADSQGGPASNFRTLDRNRDGWLTRNEWNVGAAEFNRLDANRDNRISNYEFQTASSGDYQTDRENEQSNQQFDERFLGVDRNHDGWITRAESGMSTAEFNRLDTNSDNRISRFEFDTGVSASEYAPNQPQANRTAAWRSGYARGVQEGRQAGREDSANPNGWDLEGQRELEQADSGYTAQVGSLSDYQAGYRAGFRNAYREGFTTR